MQLSDGDRFDTVIIGAGMSGLAAGIRLAMFGRDVLIVERHNAPGGLNSFYSFDGRKYDVGLHAVTNYVPPGTRGRPLTKLLRQLRIPHRDFALCPQRGSRVAFPGIDLRFNNDFEAFEAEVARAFPGQIDGFRSLVAEIRGFDEVALDAPALSAREVVGRHLTDPVLIDMLFCPVMYYGSSQERDMDFGQFAIMFKSLFEEGFARPYEGVRQIIRVLLQRYRELGGRRRMKCGVRRIVSGSGRAQRLVLDDGTEIEADHVISTIGQVETGRLCGWDGADELEENIGRLSFVETITILDRQPREFGWDDTIVFFNDHDRFEYGQPADRVDPRSGVICFPNNYDYGEAGELDEGILRVTALANFDRWADLPEDRYRAEKERYYDVLRDQALRFLPGHATASDVTSATVVTDMFTPRTVLKYTGHLRGAIYGATRKVRDGRTPLENLYLCGTDQGFLGIIGAMLSGISMANLHILSRDLRSDGAGSSA